MRKPDLVSLALISLLSLPIISFAGPPCVDCPATILPCCCPVPKILRDGLYLGIGAGYDAYRFRQSANVTDAAFIISSINPALSAKGWNGSLFAGYGLYFSWVYIGGEISANVSDAHTQYSVDSLGSRYHVKLNVHNSYSAAILPGVRFNNATLLYGRLGYVRTYLKSREKAALGYPIRVPIFSKRTTKWGNGIQAGLGLETVVWRNFSLRGEYTYTTDYSSIMSKIGSRFTPSNNQFVLGMIYHICL
jgi:opacity protein-like surface antigen